MKTDYLSIRIEPMLKKTLQIRANNKQHTLSETVTQILIDRLLEETMIFKFKKVLETFLKWDRNE